MESLTMKKYITPLEHLHACSQGEISSGKAIKGIGADGFRQLLDLMIELEIPLPRDRGQEDIVKKEIKDVAPIFKKLPEEAKKENCRAGTSGDKSIIKLVIPDSGPLISLAKIDRLDILQCLQCPVVVIDTVKIEILEGPTDAPDVEVLKQWFEDGKNRIRIQDTTYGHFVKQNRELLKQNQELLAMIPEKQDSKTGMRLRMKNSGEFSIKELSDTMSLTMSDEDTILVLFENNDVREMHFRDNVHLISNWSYIQSLENFGMIPSAADIFDKIEKTGRIPARNPFEKIHQDKGSTDDLRKVIDIPSDPVNQM